jgi:hypothetical protein
MICNWRLIPGNPVVASNTKKAEKGDTTTFYRQQKIKLQKLPNEKLVNPKTKATRYQVAFYYLSGDLGYQPKLPTFDLQIQWNNI